MKGLILSGGKGTRLRPFTFTGAKQLVPIANKPVLFYAIENLVEAGIEEIGIVVGDTGEQIMAPVGAGSRFGARVTYLPQDAPLGIAHAVKIARPFLGTDRFVLFLGDNFIREGIAPLVATFRRGECDALIVLAPVPNPQDFGIAELQDGRLVRVVEKPQDPPTNLAVTGIYMFDEHVFEAVESIRPSARGELEITDTIQYLIDQGRSVLPQRVQGAWIDTGKMEDILEANRLVLEILPARSEGYVDGDSRLIGTVVLEEGSRIENSVVRGPAIIGRSSRIVNSYVGPFSSIDHHCVIENCEIEHSIVLECSTLRDVSYRIEESLIGRYVEISRSPLKPKGYKLMIGDHSKVGMV